MPAAIRTFSQRDIKFALGQTSREGWDNTSAFFEVCLKHDPHGCFIAEIDGQRVGMVTTTRFRQTGWIGNLIVPPEYRQKGIGTELMNHAMEHLTRLGIRTLRLEADPPGVKLYRRLGFVDEFESLRFRLDGHARTGHGDAKRLTEGDLQEVAAFDAECFGDDRGGLLRLFLKQMMAAYLLRDDGQVRGYAMAAPSLLGVRVGPWVAADRGVAHELLRSILADTRHATVVLGVPCPNVTAVDLLETMGFCRKRSSIRMRRGRPVCPGDPGRVFAIANGAMG
jgi:ribosomal protein S18 acetylase RimI-like enzyme